jgi:hypothetical protein
MTWGAISPGRCPLCVAAGAAHSVYIDGAPPPNQYQVEEFWADDGKFHMHDRQVRVAHMRCSNDHHWAVNHLSRCPCRGCDWNNQPEVNGGTGWPEPPATEATP